MQLEKLYRLKYIPLRVKNGRVYYLTEEGIIRTSPIDSVPEKMKLYYHDKFRQEGQDVKNKITEDEYIISALKKFIPDKYSIAENPFEEHAFILVRMATAKLEEGDSYDTFQSYLNDSVEYVKEMYKKMEAKRVEKYKIPQGIDRFIVKILKPNIIRVPENENKNTFDIIKVRIDIITQWETDRTQYIKDNKTEIIRRAIDKIAQDSTFLKYGVDVNILALTKMHRLSDNMIELIFELKKEIREDTFQKK